MRSASALVSQYWFWLSETSATACLESEICVPVSGREASMAFCTVERIWPMSVGCGPISFVLARTAD